MKNSALTLLFILLFYASPAYSLDPNDAVQLFMQDGQLKSHPIRVFITYDIKKGMTPKLKLNGSHAISKKSKKEDKPFDPKVIARNQKEIQKIGGQEIELTGTLMIFDLRDYPIPFYKSMVRVTPTLIWEEKDGPRAGGNAAVTSGEVYLGNSVGAYGTTAILVTLLILIIVLISRQSKGKAMYLLCSTDGHLSLWRTQLAAWTVAIGGVVTSFGLIRLEVPEIPASLVALMGLSLTTGGISHVQSQKNQPVPAAPPTGVPRPPRLFDLISDVPAPGAMGELSIARAQMFFWTCLMLVLFVAKSLIDGVLWEVPWEMVTLMGMSQAGYLGPKIWP